MFDWFWEFLYSLLKSMLYCVDFIIILAQRLVGIKPVQINGQGESDLLYYFLTNEQVIRAFSMVSIIGIALLFIFTAFAVARSAGKLGEGKSPLRVCMDGAKAILYFLLIPAIMIIGNFFVTAIMTSIYRATSAEGLSLGGSMLTIFGDDAYKGSGAEKEEVYRSFANGLEHFNYNKTGDVKHYFSLKEMNYFVGYASSIFVIFMLLKPLFSFIERIISLVLLFIIAPIPVSTSVLDEGERFKAWRDEVLNKFIVAYGSLIALNVYIILVGAVQDVNFFTSADSSNPELLNGLARLVFIMGGAFACKMSTVMLGNLVNKGAGSQYAQDAQNVSSPFARMAHTAGAFGAGALLRNPLSNSIRRNFDSAMHRRGNARRFMKEEAMRQDYSKRHPEMFSKKNEQAASNENSAYAGARNYGASQNTATGVGSSKQNIATVLSGKGSGASSAKSTDQRHGEKDNTVNRSSAATVKDAMKNTRTLIDNDGAERR